MPRRLLAPTDCSPPSERAVRYAADMAEATGADLEIVHVCHRACAHAAGETGPDGGRHAPLEALAEEFSGRGISTGVTVLGPAEPTATLMDKAEAADLVVIATRGESGERDGLGSVAAAVAERARAPVLLVGPDTQRLDAGLRVLVSVDLSPASAAALREAWALAEALGGSVEVVHAIPDEVQAAAWGGESVEADDEDASARRLRYVEQFAADALVPAPMTYHPGPSSAPPVRVRLAEGDTVEAVTRSARDLGADLVLAGRSADRPTSVDALLDAVGVAGRPTIRVPAR